MKKKISHLVMGVLCCLCGDAYTDVVGSDSEVSILPNVTFPGSPVYNRIAAFGMMQNGFTLQDSTTTVLFDSAFPVSGTIALNNGTLILGRDLIFNNPATIQNLGTITGNNHTISLSQSITTIPANAPKFYDTKLVLNNDVTITGATSFFGMCSIEGNGHKLILGNAGAIKVNGQLVLHNVALDGVAGSNVKCVNDSSLLILDDATLIQKADTNFLIGAFQCRNEVVFKGAYTFAYQTLKTSVIQSHATLLLDAGFTFLYDPTRLASKSLLSFADKTSAIVLNGATLHTNRTGLNLTKGSMVVRGDSFLCSEVITSGDVVVDNGITFGNGTLESADFACTIASGARLLVTTGSVNYKNMLSSSWAMENSVSMLNMGVSTTLRLYNTLNLAYGMALCDDNVTIARVPSAQLLGNVSGVNNLFFAQI